MDTRPEHPGESTLAWPLTFVSVCFGVAIAAAGSAAIDGRPITVRRRYATEGELVGGFAEPDLGSAFERKNTS